MIFEQIPIGGSSRNFSYVIGDEDGKMAAVFDPAYDPKTISAKLDEHGLKVEYIVHTHGHYDHTGGSAGFKAARGGKIVANGRADIPVEHGDTLELGRLTLEFFHTPGHTADGICILCEDKLITGDTLFVGKVGGTSTAAQAQIEYDSLHNILMKLPDHLEVYPGHDYGVAPNSTIGHERQTNPFLLQPDFDAFLHLKNTWNEYKRKHGIK